MDELILRRAQKGDASAFEQLVTPYEQMIWRVCWHYLHHREDAMDCAQEVMLKAWRSIGQYRQDCGFSSWLYRIAGSVCIDFLRKQKRMVDSDSMDAMAENGFEPADDSPTPEAALLDRESTGDISRALDQLPAISKEHLIETLRPTETLVPRIAERQRLFVIEHGRRGIGNTATTNDGGSGELDILGEHMVLPATHLIDDLRTDEKTRA